jgi:hypothetical protein
MADTEKEPWESKPPEKYFSRSVDEVSIEYPSNMGPEAWLLEQAPMIGAKKARALLRVYGLVANIPTEDHQRQAIVEAAEGMGQDSAKLLQETLKQWESEGVLGGMDYDENRKPYTIFFPEELN